MRSPLDSIAPPRCICAWPDGCLCCDTEKALRWIGWGKGSLTPEQREWCLAEIDSVEGYERRHYERASDADVAKGVLHAWTEYARDKGLLA